jgi:uncharacterized protein (DUF488 family)
LRYVSYSRKRRRVYASAGILLSSLPRKIAVATDLQASKCQARFQDDLRYFAKSISGVGYEHIPELAPTQDILDDYKKSKGAWSIYAEKFFDLMARRKIENIDRARLDGGCLLCSEDKPHHCHRRLVADISKINGAM